MYSLCVYSLTSVVCKLRICSGRFRQSLAGKQKGKQMEVSGFLDEALFITAFSDFVMSMIL